MTLKATDRPTPTPRKRGKGEGSIRKRPDGRWEARYRWLDGDGKSHQKSVYGPTRAAVQTELRERLRAIERGYQPRNPGARTVGDLLDAWMAYREPFTAPGTRQTHETRIRLYLDPLRKMPLAKLRPRDISALYRDLHERIGPNTVRGAHSVLHAALGWAMREELIVTDPSAHVDPELTKRATTQTLRALTLDETRAVLAAVADAPDRALWVLALTTGLRFGELAGLRWDAVNLTAGVLRVERTVSRVKGRGLVEQRTKTPGSVREVLLPRLALDALAAQPRTSEYVFAMPDGGPIYQTWANRRWHAVQSAAGIPRNRQVRLHDTRRTVATLEAGVAFPRITQARLGHAAAAMTMHYQDAGSQRPVVDHIDRVLAS